MKRDIPPVPSPKECLYAVAAKMHELFVLGTILSLFVNIF